MLKWALIFFLVSLVAGVLGFTNIASGARTISRALFFVALLAAVAFLLFLFMTSGWW